MKLRSKIPTTTALFMVSVSLVLPLAEANQPGKGDTGIRIMKRELRFNLIQFPRPRPSPDIALPDLEGNEIRLSALRGKVIVLNFWATWCPPCIEEMPSLERLHGRFRSRKFAIVAVSVDAEGAKPVRKFIGERGFTFRVLLDPGKKTEAPFGVRGLPISYVIDHKGRMVAGAIGAIDWSSKKATTYFENLIRQVDPP